MSDETSVKASKARKIAILLFGIVLSVAVMIFLTIMQFRWLRSTAQLSLFPTVSQLDKFGFIMWIILKSVLLIFGIALSGYLMASFIEWISGLIVFKSWHSGMWPWAVIETLLFYFTLLWFLLP